MKCGAIKHLYVPQYETLKIELILEEVKNDKECLSYLPCPKEILKLPKQYLVNLIYSIIGEDFARWVQQRIEDRNVKVTVQKDLMINLDDDLAAAFFNSSSVSL